LHHLHLIYLHHKSHHVHDTVNDRGEQTDPNNVIFENASYSPSEP
ncbi:putative AdoMet-dependent methyltransferase, partial [Snodgrassella alvi SCGC AB-598-J21]